LTRRSWRWTFGFVSIFAGFVVPLIILLVPEHAFDREAALEREKKLRSRNSDSQYKLGTLSSSEYVPSTTWGPYIPSLRLFTGRKSNENLLKILLRSFPLMAHPAVLWGSLTQGTLIVFLVAVSTVIAALFGGAPHFFSNTKVGLFYVGPFLGGLIGFVAAGLLSDSLCKLLTKWNHNVYEPEFRMVLVIFQVIGATIGLFPFGISVDENMSYYISITFFAFVTFALIMGATATGTYIVDAHLDMAVEAFLCITLFKNLVSFGMTLHVYDILIHNGSTKVLLPWGVG
jgi:MFS family permease